MAKAVRNEAMDAKPSGAVDLVDTIRNWALAGIAAGLLVLGGAEAYQVVQDQTQAYHEGVARQAAALLDTSNSVEN